MSSCSKEIKNNAQSSANCLALARNEINTLIPVHPVGTAVSVHGGNKEILPVKGSQCRKGPHCCCLELFDFPSGVSSAKQSTAVIKRGHCRDAFSYPNVIQSNLAKKNSVCKKWTWCRHSIAIPVPTKIQQTTS